MAVGSEWPRRVASACVFAPLVAGLLWMGGWYRFCLVALIVFRGNWEWFRLAERAGYRPVASVGAVLAVAWCIQVEVFGLEHGVLFAMCAVAVALIATLRRGVERFSSNAFITLGGFLYVGLLGSAPLLIAADDRLGLGSDTAALLVVVLLSIWLTDTAAYVCGTLWGRAKLAPVISPGKSRVGFVCGIAGGLVPVLLHDWVPSLAGGELLLMLFLVSIASQLGDLVESAIKRDFGVKDAPVLIPGHGGVLDRFDSYFLAYPAAYLYLNLLRLLPGAE